VYFSLKYVEFFAQAQQLQKHKNIQLNGARKKRHTRMPPWRQEGIAF